MGYQRRRRVVTVLSAFLGVSATGGGLTVTASPPSLGGANRNTILPRTFGPCTALPAGGSGNYTYAWTVLSSSGGASVGSPSAQATTVTLNALFGDTNYTIVRCTVTDVETSATARVDILVQYTVYDTGGIE